MRLEARRDATLFVAVLAGSACFSSLVLTAEGAGSCTSKTYPLSGSKVQALTVPRGVYDLYWTGDGEERDKFIFATSGPKDADVNGGGLWYSDDYGKAGSFVEITEKYPDLFGMVDGDPWGYAGVVDVQKHRSKAGAIFVHGAGSKNWVSKDYGMTYEALPSPGNTLGMYSTFKVHPTQHDWILAKVERRACADTPYWTSTKWCAKDLFVSEDFGESWQNLTANSHGYIAAFVDYDWGANLHKRMRTDLTDRTIMATAYESPDHLKGPYQGWDKDVHFVISHDYFKTEHQKVVSCGNQFEIVGSKVYMALPASCPQFPDGGKRDVCREPSYGSVMIYVSDDEAQSFTQACIPVRDFDLQYSMLTSHDGEGSFLMIDHQEKEASEAAAPMSNIYAAGEGHPIFSMSLPRAYTVDRLTDFRQVEGLPGIYMANQLDVRALESAYDRDSQWVSTKISFNGGAHWQNLERPESFRHPECDQCSQMADPSKCKLHLHGPASYGYYTVRSTRPSFYSHANAPGVVMAVGNVGEFLDTVADEVCTWLSNDGGLTWRDIAPGNHIYEFGDYGGIVMMGRFFATRDPTSEVRFSLDQGSCWHSVRLSEALHIENIRVEPQAASHTFIVHGYACQKSDEHPDCTASASQFQTDGKVFVIDVKDVMGTDFKVCGDADYEIWSPPRPEQCLLGMNYTFHRRRADAACFNPEGFQRPKNSSHPCPCQAADVECDFGYVWNGAACEALPDISEEQCPAMQQRKYTVSETHKRRIQTDVCGDIGRVIPDTDGQGEATRSGSHSLKWLAWLLGSLGVVALLAIGVVCYSRGLLDDCLSGESALKEQVIGGLMTVSDSWSSAFSTLRERLTGRRREADDETGVHFQPLSGGEEFGLSLNDIDAEEARSPPLVQQQQ